MIKLLHRPIPIKDESPGSVLLRASFHNGWLSPLTMLCAYNIQKKSSDYSLSTYMHLPDYWKRVYTALGINKDKAKNNYYKEVKRGRRSYVNFKGTTLSLKHLNLNSPSICPICIKERKHLLMNWDNNLINNCTKHKIQLVSICRKCKEPIKWNRRSISTCSCGFDLTKSQKLKKGVQHTKYIENIIETSDSKNLLFIHKLHDTLEKTHEVLDYTVDNEKLIKLAISGQKRSKLIQTYLYELIQEMAKVRGIHPRVTIYPLICSKDKKISGIAHAALKKVQKNKFSINPSKKIKTYFIKIKDASCILGVSNHSIINLTKNGLLKASNKKTRLWEIDICSINILLINLTNNTAKGSKFKNVQEILMKPNNATWPSIIKDIIDKSLPFSGLDITQGIYSIKIKNIPKFTPTVGNNKYLSIKEVASICNVHYENIRFLIHGGIIDRIPADNTKGRKIFIHEKVAEAFNKKYVFAGPLALMHNTCPGTLSAKLIASGIKPISGRGIDHGIVYLFKRSDIDKKDMQSVINITNLSPHNRTKKINKETDHSGKYISLKDVSRILNIHPQTAGKLVKRNILIRGKTNTREIYVTQSSIIKLQNLLSDNNLVTINEASTIANQTKRSFMLHWIESGFCKLIDLEFNKFINVQSLNRIIQFKNNHITIREASKLANTPRHRLINLKNKSLIKPAKTLLTRGRKIHYFKKIDLDNFL